MRPWQALGRGWIPPRYARNRVYQLAIRYVVVSFETEPFAIPPTRIVPARQQRQILLPFPGCQLSRLDARAGLPKLVIHRQRLAFPDFKAETPRRLPVSLAHEPQFDGAGRHRPRDRNAMELIHVARQLI